MYPIGLLALLAAAHAQAPDVQVIPPPERVAPPDLAPPTFREPLTLLWPDSADPEGLPVTVRLVLSVDEAGAVTEVVVIEGEPPFVDVAVVAARAAKLEPAREGGVPIAVDVPLTLTFAPPAVVVEGTVTLSGGGNVPAVEATVRAAGVAAITDAQGKFHLRGLPPGPVHVEVLAPGVHVEPVDAEIVTGQVLVLALWASPEVADPGIVGTYRKGRTEIARRSLDAAELRVMPGSLGDPLRAVVNLPGTSRSPLDTGWLLVRGGDPRDTAVYVDGVRLPLVYHLGGYTSVLHPAFIDRVDFLPGGGSVRYGRSVAGTVDVLSRPGGDRGEVRVGANLVFAGVYANVPTKAVTVSAAVRRSYLDAVLTPVLPEGGAASIPQFWDWQARADFGSNHAVYGFGFADTLTLPSSEGSGTVLEIATERLHERSRFYVGDRSVTVTPFLAWEHLRLDVSDWEQVSLREHWGGGVRVELTDDTTAAWSESAGWDAEAFTATVRTNELSRTAPIVMPDVYGDVRFGRDTQLVAGVRIDTLFVGGQPARLGFSPRLAFQHPFSGWLRLEAEAGGHHEPPPWELLLGPPEGADLELDETWSGSVTVIAKVGPTEITLDTFARDMTRVTTIEVDGSLVQGAGLAYGTELSAKVTLARFSALGRISYTRSLRQEDVHSAFTPSPYDQPFSIGLVSSYDLGKRWTLAGRFRYASGFYVGHDDLLVFDALTNTSVPIVPSFGKVEAYHTLDLKVSHRFLFRTWRLDAWLDLENVYNHRVPEPVVTGFADLTLRDLGFGFMTLPIFGVEGQWGGDPRRP